MSTHFAPLTQGNVAHKLRLRNLMEAQQRLEIGNRIRELRERSPHTNRSIGDYVGVGERSVGNWISGDTGITWDHAKKVAELFEVDVRWLWGGDTPDVIGELDGSQLDRIEQALGDVVERLEAIEAELIVSDADQEGQQSEARDTEVGH